MEPKHNEISLTSSQKASPLETYVHILQESIDRVSGLLDLYMEIAESGHSERAADILRAAVVLIHAHLEDSLRTLAEELLPRGDEVCLRDIPLAGFGSFGRGERFVLGQLARHRGKTVDQLLRESVAEHLSRSNYNNTTEIASLLSTLGFNLEEHNKQFDAIERMIQRRHQIVHRADREKDPDTGLYVVRQIDLQQVHDWFEATFGLTIGLVKCRLKEEAARTMAASNPTQH